MVGVWCRDLHHARCAAPHCVQLHERLGLRVCVTPRKLAVLAASGVPQAVLDAAFTTDPRATPVHVTSWGFLGEVGQSVPHA